MHTFLRSVRFSVLSPITRTTTTTVSAIHHRACGFYSYASNMVDSNVSAPQPDAKKPKDNGTREVKILMLHGYTQSGALFRAKTRALEKLLAKSLAPLKLRPTLLYPTAPNRLSARDIPGYEPVSSTHDGAAREEPEMDAWAWFRKDERSGAYRLLPQGMQAIATCIRDEAGGHVDGVVGFSQGGAMAAMVASALEYVDNGSKWREIPPPPPPSAAAATTTTTTTEDYSWDWVSSLRKANGGKPLKFSVIYSGFYAPPAELGWLYEPKIKTPTLHFIGSLDTVVEESRSQGLVDRSEDPVVVVHPGGHYVPVNREWVMPLVGFVRKCCEDGADTSN